MASNRKEQIDNFEQGMGDNTNVSFVININEEGTERPRTAPPKRFRNYQKKTVSREDLEQKQMEAEKRRKEKEKEMLLRVQQTREEVQRLNTNFSALLEQDAKRHSAAGTSDIPDMSRQQLKEKFRAVNKDYIKMTNSISSNARLPD